MHRSAVVACLGLVLALGACGPAPSVGGGSADGDGGAGGAELVCGDAAFEQGELATMPSLDTLPDEVLAAVDDTGNPAVDTSLDWRVVVADDDEVVLIREFQPSEPAAASGDTHGTMRLGPITAAPNIPDGTWFVWGGSSCSPRRADGAGDGQAELRLAETPVVDDTQLTLLVLERRCASGRSADGRIDLGEPLGDRTVVDASLVPPRELQVDAEGPSSDPATEDRDAAVERALSFEVWPDYTLLVDTRCECLDGTYEVVVRDGEVVSRRAVTPTGLPADADPQPALAPSVAEVLERLRLAYDEDPESITDIAVAEDGTLIRVAFDPWRDAIDDEVTHRFQVDVDAPGDPVRDG